MGEYAKKLIDTALLAGSIMLECNAESYRIEETMNYILSTSHYETCEAFAMATGLIATLDDDSIECITEMRRVSQRGTNLNSIYKVNNVSRDLVAGKIDLDTAYNRLNSISEIVYPQWSIDIGLIIMCGGYSALYGGGLIEMFAAALSGIILPIVNRLDKKVPMGTFITNILSLLLMGIIIIQVRNFLFPQLNAEIAIIGAMMPLVPGTAITNAIRDTLRGDYNSGMARTLEAFVIAVSVAIGVALAIVLAGGASL